MKKILNKLNLLKKNEDSLQTPILPLEEKKDDEEGCEMSVTSPSEYSFKSLQEEFNEEKKNETSDAVNDHHEYERDNNLICPITLNIIKKPVQLLVIEKEKNSKNSAAILGIYMDEEEAINLLKDTEPKCPITRQKIIGYVNSPKKKKEIEAYLVKNPKRKEQLEKEELEIAEMAKTTPPSAPASPAAAPANRPAANQHRENFCCGLTCIGIITLTTCLGVLLPAAPCDTIHVDNRYGQFKFNNKQSSNYCMVSNKGVDMDTYFYIWPSPNIHCHFPTDSTGIGEISTHYSGVRVNGDVDAFGCRAETRRKDRCNWVIERVCPENTDNQSNIFELTHGFVSALMDKLSVLNEQEYTPKLRGFNSTNNAAYWKNQSSWKHGEADVTKLYSIENNKTVSNTTYSG